MKSRFITFEGIDGAGKSTHIAALTERLAQGGAAVVNTREPGGTVLAETLRGLFLHSGMDSLTEALLVFAGRRDHLQRVIEPALAAGQTVLCDRFTDASFAYQGAGRGMDLSILETLEDWVQEGRQPDLTLWFDLPALMAAQRRAAAREADRFEQQDLEFFERVRGGYAERAAAAPQRFARIDASLSVPEVAAQIAAVMEARGW
ncbi:dTMP kinase [Paucibacter oligotrophus]|uniref:Thymidylate kinase n=1 Tax=Roseateles oligotrophus TaxID=1769250 RepID=A0ABT2YFW9_9BURK|nr:dTMP kinase [Roseateles oligotrophus]MCV2368958.1 dTMP kinase [Roseateles oligotrophus]